MGREWELDYRKRSDPELDGSDGVTHFYTKKAHISDDMDKLETADTILHEIMHVVIHEMSIPFRSQVAEEMVVRPLASGLLALLYENPEVLAEIQALMTAHANIQQKKRKARCSTT
jgi:hypothetical protein